MRLVKQWEKNNFGLGFKRLLKLTYFNLTPLTQEVQSISFALLELDQKTSITIQVIKLIEQRIGKLQHDGSLHGQLLCCYPRLGH